MVDYIISLQHERNASKEIQVRAEISERAKPSELLLQAINSKMQTLIVSSTDAQKGNEEDRKPEEKFVDNSAAASPPKDTPSNVTSNLLAVDDTAGISNDGDDNTSVAGESISIAGDVAASDMNDEAAGGEEAIIHEPALNLPGLPPSTTLLRKNPENLLGPRCSSFCYRRLNVLLRASRQPARDELVQVMPWIRVKRSENLSTVSA